VFIDPPFGSGLEAGALELLDRGKCLAEGARVYLETARQSEAAALPAGWIIDREKQLGEVRMQLLKKV
jgi:16S rRNA G966 N2-methylase RsmD